MSIKQIELNGQISYQVNVSIYDKNGNRHQRRKSNIASKTQAERTERVLIRELEAELLNVKSAGPKWGELVEKWELAARANNLFGKQIQSVTINDHIGALRTYTNTWWDLPANQIERADAHEVFELMKIEGKSHARKKNVKSAINTVFNWAIDTGLLKGVNASPAQAVSFGRVIENEPEILNINEIRTLLKTAKQENHPWYPVWAVALLTGMRNGELYALKWSDVDWDNRQLTVSKSYSSKIKGVKSTKSGQWRSIPINDELLRLLKELRAGANGRPEILPRLLRWANGDAARILRTFCVGHGLPSIRFHALRACFATQLIRENIAPGKVMKICGWADMKTMQCYIRLAGIEITGATNTLSLLPDDEVMGKVSQLFVGN
jgi:integrase